MSRIDPDSDRASCYLPLSSGDDAAERGQQAGGDEVTAMTTIVKEEVRGGVVVEQKDGLDDGQRNSQCCILWP